jgi:hypothetical protein
MVVTTVAGHWMPVLELELMALAAELYQRLQCCDMIK